MAFLVNTAALHFELDPVSRNQPGGLRIDPVAKLHVNIEQKYGSVDLASLPSMLELIAAHHALGARLVSAPGTSGAT